jgi:hypothetical protein
MPGLDRRSQGTRDYLTVGSRGVNCHVERRVRGLLSMSCNAPDVHGHRGPRDLHRARALQRYVLRYSQSPTITSLHCVTPTDFGDVQTDAPAVSQGGLLRLRSGYRRSRWTTMERAPVRPLDRSERPVGGVAKRDEVGAEPVLRETRGGCGRYPGQPPRCAPFRFPGPSPRA